MPDLIDSVSKEFKERFHRSPSLFAAPGRINLIGEHVDYNQGLVLPAAIDKQFTFAIAPSKTDKCNIYAADFREGVSFSITDLSPGESWVNYMMGVMDAFHRRGIAIGGFDCLFGGNIPAGAGLSSSAALCTGFAFALNQIFNGKVSRLDMAKMAQFAEHEFAGVNCGIMDQYACLFGEPDTALMLDCKSLTHEPVPLKLQSHSLLLVDTKVKHTLASSAYNERRASCQEGVRNLQMKYPQVQSLRDATRTMLYENQDNIGEETFVKCLFVVEEIERTRKAVDAIKANDFNQFGELMYQSHWGLSQAYDVSCDELDFLVLQAEENKNIVPGSRMMGGGFGGCTINLVSKNQEGIFKETVRKKYFDAFKLEPDFYSVSIGRGAHRVE